MLPKVIDCFNFYKVPSSPRPTKIPAQPQSRRSPRTLRSPPSTGPPRIKQEREDKKKAVSDRANLKMKYNSYFYFFIYLFFFLNLAATLPYQDQNLLMIA